MQKCFPEPLELQVGSQDPNRRVFSALGHHLGGFWGPLGRILGALGGLSEAPGALLGSSWGALGATFGHLEWLGSGF